MLIIKQLPDDRYQVKHLFENFSNVEYDTFESALNLCRLRCHKVLNDNDEILKVIKIPFTNLWVVW
jgi:hypothetical protein